MLEDSISDGSSNSQFFKTYEETKDWLDDMLVKNYKINEDTLVVDAYGDINIIKKNIKEIPVKFGVVRGCFSVNGNTELSSLIGSPDVTNAIFCGSTGIKNFNGLGKVDSVCAKNLNNLENFEGLPSEIEFLDIESSCHNINQLDHFPAIIKTGLYIRPDFRFVNSLYKHCSHIGHIRLSGNTEEYGGILRVLYLNGLNKLLINNVYILQHIMNSELSRQPDPRKRNILKVAQELSNAGYHHLTIM